MREHWSRMTEEQLDAESQSALMSKDSQAFLAIEAERARRRKAIQPRQSSKPVVTWTPEMKEEWRKRSQSTAEEPSEKPTLGFRRRLPWWEILAGLALVAYLVRSKFMAVIAGG